MGATTSRYGMLDKPQLQSGRYIVQCGKAKFLKKAKTVSIQTDLKTVRFVMAKIKSPGGVREGSGMCLYSSGTVASKRVIISRATLGGTMSGATFWYQIIGEA